jgi:hypothetical protein
MTPKEKAEELYFKMYDVYGYDDYRLRAIKCALITVDEILDLNLGLSNCDEENWAIDKFYLEVKQEIEKL